MVSIEGVYEEEHSVPSSGINYLIYPGEKKTIIWTSIIQVGVIDTNSLFPTFLCNDHHIFQPVWIFDFPDKSGYQQLINLSLNDHLSIRMEASNLLANETRGRYDVELVRGHRWMDF